MGISIRPADKAFADHMKVKKKYCCERCGRQYQKGDRGIQLSHFHGRRKESTRFDEDNCSVLCFYCHQWFHENPQEHTLWMQKKLGMQSFNALTIRANSYKKRDDKMILLYLQNISKI